MPDDEGTMLMYGFEEAFVGGLRRVGQKYPIAVYDYTKCMDILMERDGMDEGEAVDFIETQSLNAWFGEGTPCMLFTCTLDEFKRDAAGDILEVATGDEATDIDPEEDDEDADRDPGDEDPNAFVYPYEEEEGLTKEQSEALGKALMDYAVNFMNYVKEVSPDIFTRAKEYAIDYSGNKHIKFTDIWKDEDKQ